MVDRSPLSMKWLEAFQAVARSGSLRSASDRLGVSISTVSHHLSCLERSVGATLFDHSKRPMRLTTEGEVLLRRVEEALSLLRRGLSEIWTNDLASLRRVVRLALIEEFDAHVAPEIADVLRDALPECEFTYLARMSHEIVEMMRSDELDVGVAATTDGEIPGVGATALLRDPFIVVVPGDLPPPNDLADLLAISDDLPFLRYSKRLLIGRRIDAHLRRLQIRPPMRMEFESTKTILSLVAVKRGWTVTTALSYSRERSLHSALRPAWFPFKGFTRHLSLFMRDDLPEPLKGMIATALRQHAEDLIIRPTVDQNPWLQNEFHLAGFGEP